MTLLLTVLTASLLGSLHCAGMCGPLVAVAVGVTAPMSPLRRAGLHITYHGGRLFSYTMVGVVCGVLGAGIDWGGSLIGVQRLAALLLGGTMVAAGLLGVLHYSGLRLPRLTAGAWLQRWIVRGQRAAIRWPPLARAGSIGLLTALLPCGWLYMFAVVAASTGDPWQGGAVMMAFWLGSVPILTLLGVSVQALAVTVGKRVPLAISLVVVCLGVATVGGRLSVPAAAFEHHEPTGESADAQQLADSLSETEPPCCRDAP